MMNTNKHHSHQNVFSRQADTSLEQHIPTSGLILAVAPASSASPAGQTRRLPLDVEEFDISREPAGLPAQPKDEVHDHRAVPLVQFDLNTQSKSCPNAKHPHATAKFQTSGYPSAREELPHTGDMPTSERLMERPRCGVWQDKARFSNAREASHQPAADNEITRSQASNNLVVRRHAATGASKKLAQVTLWVDPAVKTHLQRLAQQEGLSLSAAGAAFLLKSLQQHIDLEYSALLQPIIEHAIAKQMRGISTRLAWLLVRVSIDSGQTRSLVTNILGRQSGMTTDLLRSIVKQSGETARGNITRRTPQLEDVIQSVEKWLLTD